MGELSVQHVSRPRVSRSRRSDKQFAENQLPLFVDSSKELEAALRQIDVDSLSPVAAFDLLREWKQKFGK